MYKLSILLALLFTIPITTGCSSHFLKSSPPTESSEPNDSEQDILIYESDISGEYNVLGQVEQNLESNSLFDRPDTLKKQAIINLKQEAVTKYGEDVDAIINVVYSYDPGETIFDTASIYITGLAVTFETEQKTLQQSNKSKRKHKRKYRPKALVKPQAAKPITKPTPTKISPKVRPEPRKEPEFSPSELLK